MSTHSYKKRRNALVISFSPQFNEAVRAIRSELGLPSEGFDSSNEREKWYRIHHIEHAREPYKPMPIYYWYFPKEFVELIESFAYSDEVNKVNYYPKVPLDRRAMELIGRFDLPEELVNQVKAYILGEKGILSIEAALQPILIPLNIGANYLVMVGGLDASTTKKDWIDVWGKIEIVLRLSGISKTPHKRPIDSLLLRDLSFWKQTKEGKTAQEVADDWIDKHPDEECIPVEDMIRKAVERVEKIMRPNS
jgi:hypothetical protein